MTYEVAAGAIQRYQALIGAIIGFSGIILTLVVNAWLARRQVQAATFRETVGLQRALEAELSVLSESLSTGVETIRQAEADGSAQVLVPVGEMTSIYDSSTSKLGLLEGDQIAALVRSYSLVKELPGRIRLLSEFHDPQLTSRYIPVGSKLFEALGDLHAMVLEEVRIARNLLGAPRS